MRYHFKHVEIIPPLGESIDIAMALAVSCAIGLDCEVSFRFNGVEYTVDPGAARNAVRPLPEQPQAAPLGIT